MRLITKRMGRVLPLVLASSLALTACSSNQSATTQSEAKQEEKTIRILTNVVGGKTPEENKLFEKEIERLTGIKAELVKPPSDYDQKLLAAMSSGEKYDLVYLTKDKMDILVEQGVLMNLTEKIKKSPVLSDPKVIPSEEWDMIRYKDGSIYGVFNKFEGGTLPIVREDWMKKLNLEHPKTLDDFYQVLKAFKEKDPDGNGKNDTYGLSTAGLYDIQGFMSAAGAKYKYVIDKDGKRTIPYASEQAVPVYEWFAKLYKEGILDPNFATNDTKKMRELFLTDRVGMVTYWDAWVGMFNNIRQKDDPNTKFVAKGIPGAVGSDGKIMLRRGDPSLWAIPKNALHPETAMKFLEFWHSKEGNILSTLGIEGHDYIMKDGKYELTEEGKKHNMDHGVVIPNTTTWQNPFGMLPGVKEAQKIILDNKATIEVATKDWPAAEKIVQNYAFKAMTGQMPAKEAVQKMQEELKAAKLID
ncbi:extracellular solute-binding protein [Effusibacillus lacus]|uniref:ABC transporter substrate-binding protein n=1 Tax=Effusibacillus lacus TaxID=1348429 RepID=A0A292YH46_9BACL|nr:extracellular solute-binding protein [Effusibacillus lacus]TCS69534.1 carbohydrate ABC transporter substrate-binding protein (CUT1 family) [Effusibacillus lacus]GAX90057.1 ABC transporter substrate-binding protein [Effusibacillus lacus]